MDIEATSTPIPKPIPILIPLDTRKYPHIPVCVITETAVKIGTVFVKVARNEV